MEISEMRRMRLLEDENLRLKKIVAQQALDIDALKVVYFPPGFRPSMARPLTSLEYLPSRCMLDNIASDS
jgi:hypothetical protein